MVLCFFTRPNAAVPSIVCYFPSNWHFNATRCDLSSKSTVKRSHATEEEIHQKSKLLKLDTSSNKKATFLSKELKFLRACIELNAYPSLKEKAELGARLNQEANSIGNWFNNERRRREKMGEKNNKVEEGMVSFNDISIEEEEGEVKDDTLNSFSDLNSENSSSIYDEDSTLPNSTASHNGMSFDEEELTLDSSSEFSSEATDSGLSHSNSSMTESESSFGLPDDSIMQTDDSYDQSEDSYNQSESASVRTDDSNVQGSDDSTDSDDSLSQIVDSILETDDSYREPRTDDSFSGTDTTFSQTDDSITDTSLCTSEGSEQSMSETGDSFSSISTSEASSSQTVDLSLATTEASSTEESISQSESSASPVQEDKWMLPPGWTRFMANGLKTPSGVQYKSVREAIQALVKEEGETPLVDALRGVYVAKGWTNLGKGWLGKNGHKSYDFLAPDGTTFCNKAKAAAFALEHYTKEEEELVKGFNCSTMTLIKSEPKIPLVLNDLPGLNVKLIKSDGEAQRNRFSQTIKGPQLEALTSAYKEQSYPTPEQREALATKLEMPVTVVKNWFQNQRSRDRKLVKQELPETIEMTSKVMMMMMVMVTVQLIFMMIA